MKVLHIGSVCGHGGVEIVVATLIREQLAAGLQPEMYYFEDLGGAWLYKDLCPLYFSSEHSLTEVILQGGYDILHVSASAIWHARISLARSLFGGPIITTCHGAFGECGPSTHLTAVSEHTAQTVRSKCDKPVTVVRNGVDTDHFRPSDSKTDGLPILAWVGRSDDPDKDFGGYLSIVNSGRADGFDFLVVDGAPRHLDIEAWLPDNASVHRKVRWDNMPSFYQSIAASKGVLVSTSTAESCGLNLLEAGACGCPVVAPTVGGIPEYIEHRKTGVLYDRKDGLDGVRGALDWLYSGDNYAAVSNQAIEHVKNNHSAARMRDAYLAFYQQCAAETGGSDRHVQQIARLWAVRLGRTARRVLRRGGSEG